MAGRATAKNGRIRYLTRDESRKRFDQMARRYFKVSGKEFLRRWEAGEFGDPDNPYRPNLWDLVMEIPFVK